MATNNRTADVILRYQVDSASVNRVRASFTALDNELDDLRAELTGVGTAAQRGVNELRSRFAQGEASVESMQAEVEQLRRELLALDDVKVTPQVNVQRSGAGGGALERVDRFGTIGSQIAGGLGNSDLGNIAGLIGDAANSLTLLGPAGAAAVVGIGALSLAIQELNRISEEAAAAEARRLEGTKAAEAQAETSFAEREFRLREIIKAVGQAEASIANRQAEIAALEAQLLNPNFEGTQADALRLGTEIRAQIETIRADVVKTEGDISGLTAEFLELNAQVQDARARFGPLSVELGNIIRVAVPAADGLRQVYDALRQADTLKSKTGGFAGGIGDRIQDGRDAYLEAKSALITDRADAYLKAITETVQAQEALTKAQNAYKEAVAASEFRIAEIGRKLQEDLAQAETDRQRDLADAAEQAGADRVRITEDAEKERARIQKRFERSYSQAVADRDALAAKRAEEQRDDELDQLGERYKDQLKTVDKSLAQQQKVIEQRYANQVATINAAAQSAVRTEQAAAQARLSALQQGVQAAQVALINAQQSEYLIRANFYNQAISQAQVWANLMQFYTAYGFSIPGGTTTTSGGGGGTGGVRVLPTPLAEGGPAYAGKPYLVGERGPELFVPTQSGRIIPNGSAFTINVAGAQADTIRVVSRQQALSAFDGILRQMGVA